MESSLEDQVFTEPLTGTLTAGTKISSSEEDSRIRPVYKCAIHNIQEGIQSYQTNKETGECDAESRKKAIKRNQSLTV